VISGVSAAMPLSIGEQGRYPLPRLLRPVLGPDSGIYSQPERLKSR
jgi:hypothetical protein